MSKINGALYDELLDDAQQLINQAVKKLERSNELLYKADYQIPAAKAARIIEALKLQAGTVDSLPAFGKEETS